MQIFALRNIWMIPSIIVSHLSILLYKKNIWVVVGLVKICNFAEARTPRTLKSWKLQTNFKFFRVFSKLFFFQFKKIRSNSFCSTSCVIYALLNSECVLLWCNYSSINVPHFINVFNDINWNLLYSMSDSDLALNLFNFHLLRLFDEFLPVRTTKKKEKSVV